MAILVSEKTKGSIYKYSMTICSNGWDNGTHQPLKNVIGKSYLLGPLTLRGNAKTPPTWQLA